MPKPLHVLAFEQFNNNNNNNQLEAFVAFGLFMEAERLWALGERNEPEEETYRTRHHFYLTGPETERYKQSARMVLSDVGNEAIDKARAIFLQNALDRYETAASAGHTKFRGWGIVEATCGAIMWTLVAIGISILLAWQRIDILEYYQKAAGAYQQHEAQPKP